MSAGRRVFRIKVTLRSPFLFQGLDLAGHGFDASAHRDEDGCIIIPGDHLRGHLRHAIAALTGGFDSDECKALFGTESPEVPPGKERNRPARGAILLSDLKGPTKEEIAIYHRIALDSTTGAAQEGSIQLIELTAKIGEEVSFEGRLVLRPIPGLPADAVDLLTTALQLIPAMGALKSSGFGEVVADECSIQPDTRVDRGAALLDGLSITVAFDRPLLVNALRDDTNFFRGAPIVPGAAIKGALAEALRDAGQDALLGEGFTRLRISHAFPLADDVLAGRALPHALAAVKNDVRLATDDAVLAALCAHGTPGYPWDWKDDQFAFARERLGRPGFDTKYDSRGRVEITDAGLAKESMLFVVQPVRIRGVRWRFALDYNGCSPELRHAVADVLKSGLDGLGRTGARMMVEGASLPPEPPRCEAGAVLLMLETPALLTDPTDPTRLFEQYARFFDTYADATLTDCWARQGDAGHYYGFRFPAYGTHRYQPFELTEPGSVFALTVRDPAELNDLLRHGLPAVKLTGNVLKKLTYQKCPFVPENGYGEISLLDAAGVDAMLKGAPHG